MTLVVFALLTVGLFTRVTAILAAVAAMIYLVFNEGYSADRGDAPARDRVVLVEHGVHLDQLERREHAVLGHELHRQVPDAPLDAGVVGAGEDALAMLCSDASWDQVPGHVGAGHVQEGRAPVIAIETSNA